MVNLKEREKNLTERLCRYLDLDIWWYTKTDGRRIISICPSGANHALDAMTYYTFHNILSDYPYMNLRNIKFWADVCSSPWYAAAKKSFEFSSMDELEFQLSIRGF